MAILVTGASGHLGGHVVNALLERGVAASDIVAGVRTPDKAAPLVDLGVHIAHLNYAEPATIDAALPVKPDTSTRRPRCAHCTGRGRPRTVGTP